MRAKKELAIIADDDEDAGQLAYVLRTRGGWVPCIVPHNTPKDPACIVVLCRYSMERIIRMALDAKQRWPLATMLYVVRENEERLRGHELLPERIMHRPTMAEEIEAIEILGQRKRGPRTLSRTAQLAIEAAACA